MAEKPRSSKRCRVRKKEAQSPGVTLPRALILHPPDVYFGVVEDEFRLERRTSQKEASIREKVASFRCNVRAYYGTAINCRDLFLPRTPHALGEDPR
jgi:hypothetical protein